MSFFQSCSDDAVSNDNSTKALSKIKVPRNQYVVAVINDNVEFEQFKYAFKNTIKKIENCKPRKVIVSGDSVVYSYSIKNEYAKKLVRFKISTNEDRSTGGEKDYGPYEINIAFYWDRPMGTITGRSWITGITLLYSYQEQLFHPYWTSGNDWCIPTVEVNGRVSCSVLLKGVLVVNTENISLKAQGPVLQR